MKTKREREDRLSAPVGRCLAELLEAELAGSPAEITVWRARNPKKIPCVDELAQRGMIQRQAEYYEITFWGLLNASGERAAALLDGCKRLFKAIRKIFPENPKVALDLAAAAKLCKMTPNEALQSAHFLSRSPAYLGISKEEKGLRLVANENYVTWRGFEELIERTRQEAHRASAARLDQQPIPQTGLLESLASCESLQIREIWQKAVSRFPHDPAGVITAARSLVETTCKYVLEEFGDDARNQVLDLPKLYRRAATHIHRDPCADVEEPLRRILQAGATLVDGLSQLRNQLGDAHGKPSNAAKPARRHAELALLVAQAIAGSMLASLDAQRVP